MAEEYKLTYFNARGAAEVARYIFALAGVKYIDERIERDDWPARKPSAKYGQLPLLQVGDKVLAQSNTFSRYLARKYNLAGENDFDSARIDELIDALGDTKPSIYKIFQAEENKKPEIRKEVSESVFKPLLKKFEELKNENGGKWMVGNKVSWGDLAVAHMLEMLEKMLDDPKLLDPFPALRAHREAVFTIPQIKEWREKRPVTEN